MKRRAVASLVVSTVACAPLAWTPPQVDRIEGGDTRSCASTRSCRDLVVVIDTSGSSAELVGVGFGFLDVFRGLPEAGPGSQLWIALDGLTRSLGALDPSLVAVGLVGFAGEPDSPEGAAWVEAGLTNDFTAIETAGARLRSRGAGGASCHACGVRVAGALLREPWREKHCTAIVVLSDAEINLPHGPGYKEYNEWQLAKEFRVTRVARSSLVDLGSSPPEDVSELRDSLSKGGTSLLSAGTAAEVASAITGAVDVCSGGPQTEVP